MTWMDEYFMDDIGPPPSKRKAKRPKPTPEEVPPVNTAGTPKNKRRPPKSPEKVKEAPPEPPKTVRGPEARFADDELAATEAFFNDSELRNWRGPIYIGIDTGKSGAIGYVYPEKPGITTAINIPTFSMERKGKTEKGNLRQKTVFNEPLIWQIVQLWLPHRSRIIVAIEETQPRETDGGRTGHALGYGLGMWPLFLASHGFSVEMILPAVWKRDLGLCGKDKEWSRLLSQRLWPSAPLFRKKDEGRAEALLVAEAIRRRRENRRE